MTEDENQKKGAPVEPPMIDEERLKRLCKDMGYVDAPIFRDPSEFKRPVNRIASTLIWMGGQMIVPDLKDAYRQIEQLQSQIVDLELQMSLTRKNKRPAHRPRLRRDPVPRNSNFGGLDMGGAEKGVAELRLDHVELVKAKAGAPMTDRECVELLIQEARAEQGVIKTLRKLFLHGGTPERILRSISEARGRRRRLSSD